MTSIGFPTQSVAFPASTSVPIEFGSLSQQLQPSSAPAVPAVQQQQSLPAQEEPVPMSGSLPHSASSDLADIALPEEPEELSVAAALARFEQAVQENRRLDDARSERLVNSLVGALRPPAAEQEVAITGTSVSFVPGCLPSLGSFPVFRRCVA